MGLLCVCLSLRLFELRETQHHIIARMKHLVEKNNN